MKAVVELTDREYNRLREVQLNLQKVLGDKKHLKNLDKRSKHAKYEFSGEVTDELINKLGRFPSADEIIILVDGGFSHFGAHCSFNGKRFSGYVYTD